MPSTTRAGSVIWRVPSRSCRPGRWCSNGEVAIYDQQLRSRFGWLREPDPAAVATPQFYMAFDILYRGGRDPAARSLSDRAGDSSITVFSPKQFWDARACATNTIDPRGPKGK